MANTIKLKTGSGSDPSASDLIVGEIAIRTDSGKLFTKKDNGSVAEISGSGGGIDDGDKGDITVSNGGDTFTIDNGVVTSAKIADGTIVNADINASAAIDGSKIQAAGLFNSGVMTAAQHNKLGGIEANATADMTGTEILATISGENIILGEISSTGNSTFAGNVTISSSDGGSAAAPELELSRDSASPADADYLGQIKFTGESDDDSKEVYAKITGKIGDASSGTEDGILEIAHRKAGSNNISARFTSEDLKLINGTGLEVAGGSVLLGNGGASVQWGDTSALGHLSFTATNGNPIVRAVTGKDLVFQVNLSTTAMTLLSNGNVSIGANIVVGGTVDGRDVASDGTKLDGIESGATADQTASEILSLLSDQNISTTGTISSNDITITDSQPRLNFVDNAGSPNNPDYLFQVNGGQFVLHDSTNGSNKLTVESNGTVTIPPNCDFGAGIDVTGDITLSGTIDGVNLAEKILLFDHLTSSNGLLANGVTATTQSAGNNTTRVATTAFVTTAISNLINGAPGSLDTLNELAAAMNDDAAFSTTVTNSLATKMPLAGGEFTGNITFSGSQTVDGRDLSVDGAKLDGIESGATADQSNSEIKTAYEANSNTNAFTDALLSKLNGIAASATNVTNNNQLTNGAGYITGLSFNNLSGKTSGTGEYSTSGALVAGRGGGGVALTINDGYGNANVCFNHKSGTPEQNGNAARIEVNTDSTSNAAMMFEVKSNVSSGVAGHLTSVLDLLENQIKPRQDIIAHSDSSIDIGSNSVRFANGYFDTLYGSGANLTALNASNISSGTIAAARVPTLNQNTTGNAATATQLANARTIAGVSFDGSANISLNNNAITNGAGYITATLTNEQVQDIVGGMVSGNTENGITVTYQDSDGTIDFSVLSQTDENFTTSLKNKLDNVADGATNVTNTNQLTNGAGYITSADGGNAATLDSLDSTQFLRSDAADVMSQGTQGTATLDVRNTGGAGTGTNTGAIIATFKGDSDGLRIRNIGSGDYGIYNTQQNNGIELYDGGGGVRILYNGAIGLEFDSGNAYGDFKGTPTVNGTNLARVSDNITGTSAGFTAGNASNLNSGTIPDARFPSTLPAIDGSNLTGISAGATGGGSDEVFYENDQAVTTNYTITNGKNAMAAGPITINSGVTVTVGSGETLTIV